MVGIKNTCLSGDRGTVTGQSLVFGPRNSLREESAGDDVHGQEGGDLLLLREQVLKGVVCYVKNNLFTNQTNKLVRIVFKYTLSPLSGQSG